MVGRWRSLAVGTLLVLLGCAPSVALDVDVEQWAGAWENVDPSSRAIVYYNVSRERGALRFQPYGSCSPQECVLNAVAIRDGEWTIDGAGAPVAAKFVDAGFATRDHLFRLVGPSVLEVETRTVFRDDRAAQSVVERYRPDRGSSAAVPLSGEFTGFSLLTREDRALTPVRASFAQEGMIVTGTLIAEEGVVAECWGSPAAISGRRSGHVVTGHVRGPRGTSSLVIHLLDGVHLTYEGGDYTGRCAGMGSRLSVGRLRP